MDDFKRSKEYWSMKGEIAGLLAVIEIKDERLCRALKHKFSCYETITEKQREINGLKLDADALKETITKKQAVISELDAENEALNKELDALESLPDNKEKYAPLWGINEKEIEKAWSQVFSEDPVIRERSFAGLAKLRDLEKACGKIIVGLYDAQDNKPAPYEDWFPFWIYGKVV